MGDISEPFAEALTRHQAGRAAEATALYEQTLAKDPNHAGALFNLAALMGTSGRLDLAADYYQRVLAIRPDDPETLTNYGNVLSRQGARTRRKSAIAGRSSSTPRWKPRG